MSDTFECIYYFVREMNKFNQDRVIAFSISWEVIDREILFSMMGQINALDDWLKTFSLPPKEVGQIGTWASGLATKLSQVFKPASDKPKLLDTISPDSGAFEFKRSIISDDLILPAENGGYQLMLPRNDHELVEAFNQKKIFPCKAWVIHHAICSLCSDSYEKCEHSKFLDSRVVSNVTKADPLYHFWSDKSAYPS